MALTKQIKCNGIEPTKSKVFTLAAELVAKDDIYTYEEAIIQSLRSFDYYNYYYYNNNYNYNYNNNNYNNNYNNNNYNYNYNYYYNNQQEKVLALLFLACIVQNE